MNSEYDRRSLTLPKELADFVDTRVKRLAKETGEPANLSKYIRELIRADKEESSREKKAA